MVKLGVIALLTYFLEVGGISDKIILQAGYSKDTLPPTEDGQPLLLQATAQLENILDVRQDKQEISLEMTFRLFWRDTRIVPNIQHLIHSDPIGTYANVNPDTVDEIWFPDIFIGEVISLRTPTYVREAASLRLYTDSLMRFSKRINFDANCKMEFHKFPLDVQVCTIKFESWSYSNKQIKFEWVTENCTVQIGTRLYQFDHGVEFLGEYSTGQYDIAYPGITTVITLRRMVFKYIMEAVLPSAMFVLLSYCNMYMPLSQVTARVGIGMTTLLTLVSMYNGVRKSTPDVSYVTYLDMWMVVCLLCVLSFIIEFIMVTHLIAWEVFLEETCEKFEKWFRRLFPIVFLSFAAIFWGFILLTDTEFNKDLQ